MTRSILLACAALALLGAAPAARAVTPEPAKDSLPAFFVQFFYKWKSEPRGLQISGLKVLNLGGPLRALCGQYDLPGQNRQPFLVLGDSTPSVSAAWEPGSFPESDPLYPQLMQNLRYCEAEGAPVSTAAWRGETPAS